MMMIRRSRVARSFIFSDSSHPHSLLHFTGGDLIAVVVVYDSCVGGMYLILMLFLGD